MNTRLYLALGLCALLLLPACDAFENRNENPSDAEILRERLFDNLLFWQDLAIEDYNYTHTRTCNCPPEAVGPHQVVVRDGEIVSARYQNTIVDPAMVKIATPEDMFQLLNDALDQNADSIAVAFHDLFRFPTRVHIDYDQQVADEEDEYLIENFSPQVGD